MKTITDSRSMTTMMMTIMMTAMIVVSQITNNPEKSFSGEKRCFSEKLGSSENHVFQKNLLFFSKNAVYLMICKIVLRNTVSPGSSQFQ